MASKQPLTTGSSCRPAADGHGGRLPGFRTAGAAHRANEARLESGLWQCEYRNLYYVYMKTTLNLNDQLLADAKALAAQQRTSLTRLIEEGLQLRLRAKTDTAARGQVRLPVFKGRGGLVKGVNPLSNKALLEALGDDA